MFISGYPNLQGNGGRSEPCCGLITLSVQSVFLTWKDPEWFPVLSTAMWKVGQCTCSSELHHQVVPSVRLSPVPFARKTEVVRVCRSRNRKVPAYRKQEQLNSTLPNLWLLGRVLDRTVVLVSMLTKVRVALLMVPPLESVLYSTNTLALLRASWKEGHILSPAKARGKRYLTCAF